MADDSILIVGAGLGGLATALALGKRGYPVRVLEQSMEIGAIGYGIQMGPNVFTVFEALGIADAVREKSYFPDALTMLDAFTGERICRVPLRSKAFGDRYPGSYVAIHRVDLHNIFLGACQALPNIQFETAATIARFEDLGDRVRAVTTEGKAITGAALIGADGLRSTIRAQMYPDDQPHPVGYVAHRTTVAMDQVPASIRNADVTLWSGDGFHIIYYPLRGGSLLNIVAVFQTATFSEKRDAGAYKAEVQAKYRDTAPVLQEVLSLMDLEKRWPIADRDPIRRWSRGRVTLTGDAAHATLQSLAQGAGMAIEDGLYLAALLDQAKGDYAAAFERFQAERVTRTARVQLISRSLWEIYHAGGIAAETRNDEYREKTDEDFYRCLDWLWKPTAFPSQP